LATETETHVEQVHHAERRDVQWLLRIGLASAAALMLAGLLAAMLGGPLPGTAWEPRGVLTAGQALSVRLSGLGILVLAATPAFRVVTLIALWVRERDWKYVVVGIVVAVVLSLAIAAGGG
jgi:uncharacterized membrane protein